MADRVGNAVQQIEIRTRTRMKKDSLISLHDQGTIPDVEIPGTKMGLKAVVDIVRDVFGIYPKHVKGDIVVSTNVLMNLESPSAKQQVTVTVYLTQGRNRIAVATIVVPADDFDTLVQRAAETVLGQVNPYVLAVYREEHREYDEAIKIIERINQNPLADLVHKKASLVLWGVVLSGQKKYDEAIAKYQKAIELDPHDPRPYNNWGNTLADQRKGDEAITKFQKAIELDDKYAFAYYDWGLVLDDQEAHDEAIAKFQKALEFDPKSPLTYNGWGNALLGQKKYDEAIAKFQKAIELDPQDAFPYNNWGNALGVQGQHEEAIAKFRKAIELEPNFPIPYNGWGTVLFHQKKYDEAITKFQKAIELDPTNPSPHTGLGAALQAQGKDAAAGVQFSAAHELSRVQ